MVWLILLLPVLGFTASDEDKLYSVVAPYVRKVERGFTVFHWEKANGDFAEKFKADTAPGLLAMTRAASRSFVEQDAKRGFYAATDPVLSRAFGRDNWRLVQVKVPEGLKFLDITSSSGAYARAREALPGEAACLDTIFVGNNSRSMPGDGNEALARRCVALKGRLFRRLGVSAVKYTWLDSPLQRLCRGRDKSAYIFTDGAWLNKENLQGYTAESNGSDMDRRAIQELLVNVQPPRMYKNTKPAPLWNDLPSEGRISAATREWMDKNLLNCQDKLVDQGGPEEAPPSAGLERENSAE